MTVNILGTEYTISRENEADNEKLEKCDGYCDNTVQKIVVCTDGKPNVMDKENLKAFKEKVLRHEIIHAFLFESGLAENSEWAHREEIVDFFAFQIPKMVKAMQAADCLKAVIP